MVGAHLLALVCVGVALSLGLWQYDAWETRRTAAAVDLTQREPEALGDVIGADEAFPGGQVGQPVVVAGTWLPDATVLVSGREHDGRDGFWVVTPLTSGGPADPAIPVVRGWTASAADVPSPPTGAAEVVVWLQPSEGTGEVDTDAPDAIYPQLRVADLVQLVDVDLYGAYGVSQEGLDGLESADLESLPDAGRFTALRNLLYAIEWWVFGAFAVFIWWRYLRDERALGEKVAAEPDEMAADPVSKVEP